MLYTINRLNRTVNLDDELVNKYCEYEQLREQPFAIAVKSKYQHAPTAEEASDEELSLMCNEVLLSELKAFALLPKAVSVVENNRKEFENASKDGKCINIQVNT